MKRSFLFLVLLAATMQAMPALARDKHDLARQAVERGDIMPLENIMALAASRVQGRVIEVDLERDDGRWVYELELITPSGRLVEMEIDAASGRVLEVDQDDDRGGETDDDTSEDD